MFKAFLTLFKVNEILVFFFLKLQESVIQANPHLLNYALRASGCDPCGGSFEGW